MILRGIEVGNKAKFQLDIFKSMPARVKKVEHRVCKTIDSVL